MQENKRNIVIFTYVAIFSLVIPSIFWFSSLSPDPDQVLQPLGKKIVAEDLISPSNSFEPEAIENLDTAKRMSIGEKILITADQNPSKQAAAEAFGAGDYRDAITKYDAAVKIQRNDPEAWIYQNNAKAIASQDFLQIAVSVPIGGNLNVAKEILRGVAQVQQEVNSNGGIDGKLLQVAIANDDNDPLTAKQVAQYFSQDDQILGVIGHNSTEASMAAAPVYQQAGLVMISPTTVGNSLSELGSYIFRTTPDTRSTADILARYSVESARKSKVAICFASDAKASQSFKEAFEWSIFQAGGKVVEINCDFAQANFNPGTVPAQAISSGADALLLAPSIYNVNQAISVLQENKNRLPLLGNQTMYSYETLEQGRVEANGMILSVPWHSIPNADQVFTQAAQSLWGGAVGWRTAMAYDAAKAIIVGLESESKLESKPSRQKLQATLSNPDFTFTGATGKVQFLPSGDRNLKGVLVKVASGNQSGTGYDFKTVEP
jgi:branched-chain amino acid transport system substrate-binding protein